MTTIPRHGADPTTLAGVPVEEAVPGSRPAVSVKAANAAPSRTRRASLAVLALVALGLVLLLTGWEVRAPAWAKGHIERAAAEAWGGGTLQLGAAALGLAPDLRPRVRLLDVAVRDGDGNLLARIPEAAVTLSPRALLVGREVRVREVTLLGPELRLEPGGGRAAQDGLGGAARLASLPAQVEALLERPAFSALRRIGAEGIVVGYDGAGRTWALEDGAVTLDRADGTMRLSGEASLRSGASAVARVRFDYLRPGEGPAATFSLSLDDVAMAAVAGQDPALAWLRVLDAPVSLDLRAEVDGAGVVGPLDMVLSASDGVLRPTGEGPGVRLDLARADLSFDPRSGAVHVEAMELRSDWGSLAASGRLDLAEIEAGLPRALLGQVVLREVLVAPPGLRGAPVRIPEGSVQLRLRFDPLVLDLAEASLDVDDGSRLSVAGRVAASAEGWTVALDARLPLIGRDRLLALWPEGVRALLRDWFERNLTEGVLRDVVGAWRLRPGAPPVAALSAGFSEVAVRPLASHPPITGAAGRITFDGRALTMALDRGGTAAPAGGRLDLSGTALMVATGGGSRVPARVTLAAEGSITAALSLLDLPPFRLLAAAGQPADLADGRLEAGGTIDLPLAGPPRPGELRFDLAATLRDVASDVLIPGRTLAAAELRATVTPTLLEIGGPLRVGSAAVEGVWRQPLGPGAGGGSEIEALVEVSPAVLAEVGVVLPEGAVEGRGRADLSMALARGDAPTFALRSDLRGLALSLPQVGWSKPAADQGSLVVEGRLGASPSIGRLALSAPGLSVEGALALREDGSLDRLELAQAQVGGWFDGSATLVGHGPGAPLGVEVQNGSLDLRTAALGGGGGGPGGGPLDVTLDRVQVTDAVALTNFAGAFTTAAGLDGAFSGQVNGGPAVSGRVATQGGRVGARVWAADAGWVLRAAGLFTRAEGGALDLLLLPVGAASYDGEARITGLTVRQAPVLASLLNAVSVVGLLQQLNGRGLVFDEVAAAFRIDPGAITVARSSAAGPGLGLSLDGTYDTAAARMDFRGVVSPVYLLNGVGAILSRPGEGILGFNYTLRGDPASPEIGVNPLSALAPGRLREVLRARRLAE